MERTVQRHASGTDSFIHDEVLIEKRLFWIRR